VIAPGQFRRDLRVHNLHAIAMSVLSLLAAIIVWNLAYFFFVLILLGLVTAARGDIGAEIPPWIPGTAGILAGLLFLWGILDHLRRRFAGLDDRPIIGWHLGGDIFLLPVRLTLAIGGNLSAVRWLSPEEQDRAWELLTTIHRAGKTRVSALTVVEADPARLHRFLSALQLAGYIDLHRGEEDWFYTVRSTKEPQLRGLMTG
jgi:hypothetical protein